MGLVACATCGGDGDVDGYLCTNCFGAGATPVRGELLLSKYLVEKLADIEDKVDDVMDKCNDIFEAVTE